MKLKVTWEADVKVTQKNEAIIELDDDMIYRSLRSQILDTLSDHHLKPDVNGTEVTITAALDLEENIRECIDQSDWTDFDVLDSDVYGSSDSDQENINEIYIEEITDA